MDNHHNREDALNQFWNALVRADLDATGEDLTPEEIAVVHHLQRAGTAPLAGLTAEAAWPRVLARIETHGGAKEDRVTLQNAVSISTPLMVPNGHGAVSAPSSRGLPPIRRPGRWAVAILATAALLLVTLVGSLLGFGPGRPGQLGRVPA